ncbi:hypothetical protein G9F32_03170 [Acinetobacter sp. 194]|uniref:hypothetical protein n=1 Tax=Acinetobacter shaoyimingii TaxID=2715164 RepID=UPI00140A2FB8|nr:hypothetical protein [Acinetobacter shaoyimingii]NHB57034.1 hypothetical protein [Acinetobacter shaoyimingii]
MDPITWIFIGIALLAGISSYLMMQKMQKKNQPKAGQLDGTIADEGATLLSIKGSPHVHGNITHVFNQRTKERKAEGGK